MEDMYPRVVLRGVSTGQHINKGENIMTVSEALKSIKADLSKIPVRVEDISTIGNPILSAVLNLDLVISAIENTQDTEVKREAENGENVDDKG